MSQKAVQAVLKGNKATVQSEYMDETSAEAELDRVLGDLNDPQGPQFIKLGKSAMVSRADVLSLQLVEPPSIGIA